VGVRALAPRSASLASLAGGLGAILLPKCPVCFAAYGSALAALGAQRLLEPLVVVTVVASFGLVLALSVRRGDAVTPLVSAAGAVLVLAGRLAFDRPALTILGSLLLVAAAIANSVLCRRWGAQLSLRQQRDVAA